MFLHIWSRPEVVQAIRSETVSIIHFGDDPIGDMQDAPKEALLDYRKLEHQCPVLMSCYKETNRLANQNTGARYVLKDTILADDNDDGRRTYLLKKGTYVTWPAKRMHRDKAIWGNAEEFDPWRFVPAGSRKDKDEAGVPSHIERKRRQAYIPFGGGTHLCPGRNFALAEILGFMCVLILGFDVKFTNAVTVKISAPNFAEAVPKPDKTKSLPLTISKRKGWENVKWRFALSS